MPRPSRSGAPASAPNKRKLTAIFMQKLKPQARPFMVWDAMQRGLALRVEPTGYRGWKVVVSASRASALVSPRCRRRDRSRACALHWRPRSCWRSQEARTRRRSAKAQRSAGAFADLATRYVNEYAKRRNKSWEQPDYLVRRYLLPAWGKLRAADVSRADVRSMMACRTSPSVANQTLAAAMGHGGGGWRRDGEPMQQGATKRDAEPRAGLVRCRVAGFLAVA